MYVQPLKAIKKQRNYMQLHIKFERPNSLVAHATIQSIAVLFMPKRRPFSAATNFQKNSVFWSRCSRASPKQPQIFSSGRKAPRNFEKCLKLMDVRATRKLTNTPSFLNQLFCEHMVLSFVPVINLFFFW